VNLILVLISLT